MNTLSASFSLKKCAPGVAAGADTPEVQFKRSSRPVHVNFGHDGEMISTGFAFEDYSRAHVIVHKTAKGRQQETPIWAVNQSKLRALIVRFMELRAGLRTPGTGTLAERLAVAQKRLQAAVPWKVEALDRLCREYVEVKTSNPSRARLVESEIKNLDAVIRTSQNGAALLASTVYLYFRCGMTSAHIASELGVTPWSVRQNIYRLNRTWQRMQNGTDGKVRS